MPTPRSLLRRGLRASSPAAGVAHRLVALLPVAFLLPLLLAACGEDATTLDDLRRLQQQGRYEQTLEPLRALLETDAADAEIHYLYGTALARTGDPSVAIWSLRRAAEDPRWAVPANSKKPVLAHLWMNFILEEENAYSNFINFTGYQPPVNSINPERLISEGTIPEHLNTAVVEPDDLGPGSIQYMTLTAEGQRMWQDAYARFISGA